MNNPFYYTPSPECLKAVKEVTDWLYGRPSPFCAHPVDPAFRAEIDKGKMFGVLVVENGNDKAHGSKLNAQSYIAGYSGQVCGRSDWQEFVPAVFDYLQPDGYFKQHEAEITALNHEIADMAASSPSSPSSSDGSSVLSSAGLASALSSSGSASCRLRQQQSADPRPVFDKARRDGESEEAYIRRRQFENAELHRWKLRQREREAVQKQQQEEVKSLKTLRRKKSDDLQRWLFRHFQVRNGIGETRDLLQITAWYSSSLLGKEGRGGSSPIPPAGSGECCEPKLLQYAFTHGLKPVSMAMFWWGESPKGEVRHHLHFYPACNSKCKPILTWMLQGIDVDANPLEIAANDGELAEKLRILYEDDDICVVSKPAGLLSVPGKSGRKSVFDIMRRRYPESDSPLIVHRLDMATSGLMIIAKTLRAYHNLQQQFATHKVQKRYVAVLEHKYNNVYSSANVKGKEGVISLPLRPDLEDRPRQMVDFEYGREALTYYKYVKDDVVWLWPKTGRTHQLRVHCAHRLGLDNPIKGDELYGTRADRLYLHAAEITFRHPVTGKELDIKDDAPF